MPDLDPEQTRLIARLGDALGTAVVPVTLAGEVRLSVAGLREAFDAAACSFARVEADGASLRFVAADGAGADDIVGVVLPISRGIAGWVAMSGEAIQISDVAADTRFARDVAEATHYVPSTILAAPVVDSGGETVGVVELLDPRSRGGDAGHDLAVVALAASQLAAIVRLSDLYERLGAGLIRSLADPDDTEGFGGVAIGVADDEDGVALSELASAFLALAAGGTESARLATRLLRDVAAFAGNRR
jgi:signal transduction protein with GAF and PtsI domain